MNAFWGVVTESWQHHVVDAGRLPALALLAGFAVAFAIVRAIVHLIRAGRGPFHDLAVGGTHVHHLVYGIVLMLVAGFVGFAVDPGIPSWILPAVFGVGAALTLDEFALWVRLEDVYWAEEGRASVDAVLLALAVIGLAVVGAPFWQAIYAKAAALAVLTLGAAQVVTLALSAVAFLKGKRVSAVAGLLFPPVALVAAVRLARPGSQWAARWYSVAKLERARLRDAARGTLHRLVHPGHAGGSAGHLHGVLGGHAERVEPGA